jgi:prepilin-type processing-associated H-X9-DG protein
MTMSSPLILDETAAAPIGSFAGPGLGHMLPLVEVGYMATQLNKGKLTSTMISVAATNGYTVDGSSARTHQGDGVDLLAQATELFGSRNTANVFYYDGHTAYSTTSVYSDSLGADTTVTPQRDHFTRYGVTGNFAPIDQVDLTAGFAGGQDKSDELGLTVKQMGYYLEATAQVLPRWVATYRYDSLDPDTNIAKNTITANTIGTSYLLDSAVFLSAEWREQQVGSVKSHGVAARVRVVY